MQLKQLKLAGFKSFVDPTVVIFPSSLVAVVGPNGCGKSNIIDAVRWVLGESTARHLRGESMVDVIFNGSSQRKAMGQASVELIFDNSMGHLLGQYGSYQEIAIKRLITRDGESTFYLNGSPCRRRDIKDIFLGTGSGARGYSIIGQGTISQLIEARPEDLRGYFEEAAGVSKYKERRREALLRIEHTRANLERLADICTELERQLHRLEYQAKEAEHYKALKMEERQYRGEILALKWRAITQEQEAKRKKLQILSVVYEKQQGNATGIYRQTIKIQENLHEINALLQERQASFYQLATEIARLEDSLQQNQREKQRLKEDEQQLQLDFQAGTQQINQDKADLDSSQESLLTLQKNSQDLQEVFLQAEHNLLEKQQHQEDWQEETAKAQVLLNEALAAKQVEALRLQHHLERRAQISSRLEKIHHEQQTLAVEKLEGQLLGARSELNTLQNRLQSEEASYQQLLAQTLVYRQQLATTEEALHAKQDRLHQLIAQQSSLSAAQEAALGQDKAAACAWVQPRLIEAIHVEKGWQYACEFVLAQALQAVIFDSEASMHQAVSALTCESAFLLTPKAGINNPGRHPSLSSKIKGLNPSWTHSLDKIYTASSLEEALTWLVNLEEEESVITPNGYWLGKGWARIAGSVEPEKIGVIFRQEELAAIKNKRLEEESQLTALKIQRQQLATQISKLEQQLDAHKEKLTKNYDLISSAQVEITKQEQLFQQAQMRKHQLSTDQQELNADLQTLVNEQLITEKKLLTLTESCERYQQAQSELIKKKATWINSLMIAKQALETAREACQQAQWQQKQEIFKMQQIKENLHREQARSTYLQQRVQELTKEALAVDKPNLQIKALLNEKIQEHSELEKELIYLREEVEVLNGSSTRLAEHLRMAEKEVKCIEEKIHQETLQEQSLAVRAGTVVETMGEFAGEAEEILAAIPSNITQAMREEALLEINVQLSALGAINLAAIGEYKDELQRKQLLDQQYEDLVAALTMLDEAVVKMDQETSQRLRKTFAQVNGAFQALFPRLFGGGHAELELTCDNLLETGIIIKAQPPGKRNSTIHLLSGGEKAMTAVALIFAIFQLNPSPFCMLDEVDAPLDDVNIGRFCALVKEMSQCVQFLFITHNKITMELAANLIGVTMSEPGVSRIVAVDVEEALLMSK